MTTEDPSGPVHPATTRAESGEVAVDEAEARSEQVIRDSERSYRRLFESAKEGILILDADTGRIGDVNPFLTAMLGFSRTELVGTPVWELGSFKDILSNRAKFEKLYQNGYVRSENLPLKTKDGRLISVEFVSNVYRAGDRNVIQCNIRDITRQRQAEMVSHRLAAIVEFSNDGIIGKDLDGIITSWNKGAETIFGYTASEMVGTSITRLIPADRKEEEIRIMEKIRRGESVEHFETQRQTKDGRLIDVAVTVSPIKDATGKVIGVSKVVHDITGRKQVQKALRESEVRYRTLFDYAPDGILIADPQSYYLDANSSICRMLGYTREELVGLHASDLVVAEEISQIQPALDAIKTKTEYYREWRFRRKDGSVFPAEVIGTQMPDGNLMGLVRDVTERKQAEQTLREKDLQLHAADRRLADIVNGMTEACYALDADWCFSFVNDRCVSLLHHEREDMLGHSIWNVFGQLVGTPMEANFRRAMTERVPLVFEAFSTVAGRWLDIRLFPTAEGLAAFLLDIDARKRAEEAIRETQARLNSTLAAGSIGTWTWDIVNDRLTADEFTARMFSIDAAAAASGLPAEAYLRAVMVEDQAGVADALARAIQTCGPYDIEYRVRQKDGDFRWLQATGRVEGDAEGNAVSFHGAVVDVTGRKQTEGRFRRLVDSNVQGVIFWNVKGEITQANDAFLRIVGYSREDLEAGRVGWAAMTPPEYAHLDRRSLKELADKGICTPFEKEYIRKDGSRVPILLGAATFEDTPDEGVCFVLDITERKWAEQQMALEQARFKLIFDSISIGIAFAYHHPDGQVTRIVNDAHLRICGLTREQDLIPGIYLKLSHPEDSVRQAELYRQVEEGLIDEFSMEKRYIMLDGEVVWVVFSYQRRRNGDGSFEQMTTVIDITERKRAETAIQQLNTQLEQRVTERTAKLETANKELEAFSYSVSHDLRAPLRAVDGFSQAVLEDYSTMLPEEGQRYLQTIRQGAQKMGMLIDDLLMFSRLSRSPLNTQLVDIDQLVRNVLQDLVSHEVGRLFEFQINTLPTCVCDPALLRQVWVNLLSNALKYTRRCEVARVEIGCDPTPSGQVFFVRDNGTGFDMLYADKLFGVFQRLHRAEDYEGTGVGLAIVQRVVHRHGGRVWAEAAPDQGATFYFTLEPKTEP